MDMATPQDNKNVFNFSLADASHREHDTHSSLVKSRTTGQLDTQTARVAVPSPTSLTVLPTGEMMCCQRHQTKS